MPFPIKTLKRDVCLTPSYYLYTALLYRQKKSKIWPSETRYTTYLLKGTRQGEERIQLKLCGGKKDHWEICNSNQLDQLQHWLIIVQHLGVRCHHYHFEHNFIFRKIINIGLLINTWVCAITSKAVVQMQGEIPAGKE